MGKAGQKVYRTGSGRLPIGGVVEALVGFAERKNFAVVAEGVEDEVILDYIKGLKIGYGQGYYYGKPQPPEEYKI
ncbi:MAG: EAL domain-containing protein [Clostridia bacterium]|nr:EAL domain-containing protein [Clostridia bacterium]